MNVDTKISQVLVYVSNELDAMRNMAYREQSNFQQGLLKTRQLENELERLNLQRNDTSKDDSIKKLNDELLAWKNKYESLAKLYAQLRKEHLDLLNKLKDAKDIGVRVSEDCKRQIDLIKSELKVKSNELTSCLIDKEKLSNELERIQSSRSFEVSNLERELKECRDSLIQVSTSRGNEVSMIVERFDIERQELLAKEKQAQIAINDLKRRLDQVQGDVKKQIMQQDEDSETLQAGLDQTLIALATLQQSALENESNLTNQLKQVEFENSVKFNRMIDSLLNSCNDKLNADIIRFEGDEIESLRSTGEYVMSLIEKSIFSCTEFTHVFTLLDSVYLTDID